MSLEDRKIRSVKRSKNLRKARIEKLSERQIQSSGDYTFSRRWEKRLNHQHIDSEELQEFSMAIDYLIEETNGNVIEAFIHNNVSSSGVPLIEFASE